MQSVNKAVISLENQWFLAEKQSSVGKCVLVVSVITLTSICHDLGNFDNYLSISLLSFVTIGVINIKLVEIHAIIDPT